MTAKEILYKAFIGDTALMALAIGGVHQSWHKKERGYPQVTITRLNEAGSSHGDNGTLRLSTQFQINIWGKKSVTELETNVKRVVSEIVAPGADPARSVGDDGFEESARLFRNILVTRVYE
jgi:hypothetical protein